MKTRTGSAAATVLLATVTSALAQNPTATATLTEVSQVGSDYNYALTVTDTGSTSIGSLWYAWTPGFNYLPSNPSLATPGAPAGWSTQIISGPPASIQFFAGSAVNYIQVGQSATFDFTTPDSPSTLAGENGGTPIGTSVVYSGALFSSPSETFVVTSAPEPSTVALLAMTGFGLVGRRYGRLSWARLR